MRGIGWMALLGLAAASTAAQADDLYDMNGSNEPRLFAATPSAIFLPYIVVPPAAVIVPPAAVIVPPAAVSGAAPSPPAPLNVVARPPEPVGSGFEFDFTIHGDIQADAGYVDHDVTYRFFTAETVPGDLPNAVGRYRANLELTPGFRSVDTQFGATLRLFSSLNSAYDHRRGTSDFDSYPFYYTRFHREEALDFDRAYLFYDSTWGRVEAGWVNGIGDQLAVTGPFNWGLGGPDGSFPYFVDLPIDVGLLTLRPYGSANPSPRVNYISPRLAGIRIGLGYQPDTRNSGFEFDYGGDARGINGRNVLSSGTAEAVTAGFRNVYEVSLDYARRIYGINVSFGAAYIAGESINSATGARFNDLSSFQVGVRFEYRGFAVGAGHVRAGDSGFNQGPLPGQRFDNVTNHVSLQYTFGQLTVGGSFYHSDDAGDPTVGSSRQLWAGSVGPRYRFDEHWSLSAEFSRLRALSADFPDYTVNMALTSVTYSF